MGDLPDVVRDWGTGVIDTETGESFAYEFEESVVDVPSRFDDADAPRATWRFDGRLTVTIRSVGE